MKKVKTIITDKKTGVVESEKEMVVPDNFLDVLKDCRPATAEESAQIFAELRRRHPTMEIRELEIDIIDADELPEEIVFDDEFHPDKMTTRTLLPENERDPNFVFSNGGKIGKTGH